METNIIYLEETDSTNRYLKDISLDASDDITVVWTTYQTAGKGQGGHKWESERGKNLLFSVLLHPVNVPVRKQFILSMAIALSIKNALTKYTSDLSVKWPNDIYWQNKKICGILIENSISSAGFKDCILGPGIDVNQKFFYSDAPNPVSLYQILNKETDIRQLLDSVIENLTIYLESIYSGEYMNVREEYLASLYRRDGLYSYRDMDGEFRAYIKDVTDNGYLVLQNTEGITKKYAFKEVEYLINK